ncbi:MAG: type II secretion system protein [Sulfuricella sp.]
MRQRGFSLWEMAVLLGMLGVAIVAGFALLKANRAEQVESERMAQLSAADRALAGFIAEKGYLPCVDSDGDGNEDRVGGICAGTVQKGWLPVVTLGLVASAPARGAARLDYIVYRGAGADLTVLADRYNPVKYDLTATYTYNQLNTLDFCAGLTLAASATPSTASAYIPGAAGAPVNVAYALAESGIDRDGDGNVFDGLNTSTTAPVLESPARAADPNYDDIVKSRSFSNLQNAFQCPQATRSVDAISMAVATADTVLDLTQANYDNGVQQTINAAVATALDAFAIALGIAGVVDGAEVLAEAISVAAASLGLDFGADAAIGVATAGLVVQGVSIAAYATSLGLDITALIYSAKATAKAGASTPDAVPPPACDPNCQLANLKTALDNANNDVTSAQAAATAAHTAETNALNTYNTNVTALIATAHVYDSTHDALLTAALNAYQTYVNDVLAYNAAQGQVSSLTQQQSGINDAITTAQNTLNTDTAALAADPTNPILQAKVLQDQQMLTSLQTKATTLSSQLATAQTNATAAQNAMNSAYTSYTTARSTAINAYSIASPNQNSRAAIGAALDTATSSYYNTSGASYISAHQKAINADAALASAQATAASLQQAYNDMKTAIDNGTATAGGSGLQTYTGAEDILKKADAKGALE